MIPYNWAHERARTYACQQDLFKICPFVTSPFACPCEDQSNCHCHRLRLLEWGTLGVSLVVGDSLPFLAPKQARAWWPTSGWESRLPPGGTTGRRQGPSRAEPCLQNRGWGDLHLWTTPPARTGPLSILSNSPEAHYVVATRENCLWVSGQCVPRTQAAGGRSDLQHGPLQFPSKSCWVLSQDR